MKEKDIIYNNYDKKLSSRLKEVAAFVPRGSRIADIGTDHGYVPIYLAVKGQIASALAMDVRQGPLLRAKEHVREYEDWAEKERTQEGDVKGKGIFHCPIETRLSDGLKELKPGEADTVIMAGMGGELEIRILEEGRHVWDSVSNWILSPQSDLDKVRRFLADNGFLIEEESMLKEEGKFYTIMRAVRGYMEYSSQAHYLYGKLLIEKKNPILKEYLKKEEMRIKGILNTLSKLPKEDADTEHVSAENAGTERKKQAWKELSEQLLWIKEAQDEMQ